MRTSALNLILSSLVLTGCGTDVEALEETLEHRITWKQAPETEIQDCHTFKLNNAQTVEIERLQVQFPSGSHHVHIYRSSEPVADASYDCFNGIDWKKWSLVLGAQTKAMDWQLPQGVTIPFEPHQQLLAQVHWLNTTDKVEEPVVDLSFHTSQDSQEHLGVVFGVNQRVAVPALSRDTRVEHFCQMPEGVKLHAMMGHFHARGRDYRVIERQANQPSGTEIYFAKDEPSFEFKTFSPARPVARGAGFEYQCGYDNSGNPIDLTWGSDTQTQEHCNMTVYFSPAEKVSEMCVLEPSKLSALTPAKDTVVAGKTLTFAIELASPEPTDVDVALRSSDESALEVPATVRIRAGERYVSFTANTHRPARVEVSATLNGARLIRPVRVTGLVISELFYNPATGSTNELQWVEIANQSDLPLDLSGYNLGAGSDTFLTTNLDLPTVIPPRGCIVVGGPVSAPANGLPTLALKQDLYPDLGLGMSQAAGIGLFDTTNQAMSAQLNPMDVLVYGSENAENKSLKDQNGQLAPVWMGSAPGGSLRRMNETVWAQQATPTPGTCEVLNAQ